MRHRRLAALALVASTLGLTGYARAADEPKPAPAKPAATDKPAGDAPKARPQGRGDGQQAGGPGGGGGQRGGGGGGGAPGRGFGGPGGPGGGGMMNLLPDPVEELVRALSDLNIQPGFTLTDDQKAKIKQLREATRKQREEWRTEHEDDFRKLQEQFMALRGGGGGGGGGGEADREKFQAIDKSRQELVADAPKADDAVAEIKGLLTNDQLKALEARVAERKAQAERRGPGGGPGNDNPGRTRGERPAGEKPAAPKVPAGQ